MMIKDKDTINNAIKDTTNTVVNANETKNITDIDNVIDIMIQKYKLWHKSYAIKFDDFPWK